MLTLHTVSLWWMEVNFDLQQSLQESLRNPAKAEQNASFLFFGLGSS